MSKIADLREGYGQFYKKYFIDSPKTYEHLVKYGQAPKTLVIACSDSRVDPSIIMNTKPGDIFVIRNVANLVPPFEDPISSCHGTSAAIEYAVNNLHVEDIIVLGHSQCGGIKALISDDENDHTFIDNWLHIAKDAKVHALAHGTHDEHICAICEKEAIKTSLENLRSFPFIQKKINNGELLLHGWYFCLENGSLEEI